MRIIATRYSFSEVFCDLGGFFLQLQRDESQSLVWATEI